MFRDRERATPNLAAIPVNCIYNCVSPLRSEVSFFSVRRVPNSRIYSTLGIFVRGSIPSPETDDRTRLSSIEFGSSDRFRGPNETRRHSENKYLLMTV